MEFHFFKVSSWKIIRLISREILSIFVIADYRNLKKLILFSPLEILCYNACPREITLIQSYNVMANEISFLISVVKRNHVSEYNGYKRKRR